MSVPGAIRAYFKETVTFHIRTAAGEDAYGVAQVTDTTARCRIEYTERTTTNSNGQEVASSAQIYCDDVTGVTGGSRVTLPNGETCDVISVRRPQWPDGTRHLEVYL